MVENEKINNIIRIKFAKSIPNYIPCKCSLKIYVMLVGEFNEILNDINNTIYTNLSCKLYSNDTLLNENLDVYDINIKDNICSFRINISRKDNTIYRFLISINECQYVLPILSELISINDHMFSIKKINNHILYNYRNFDINENNRLIIKEDYGNTLGSHIYDCSIVLYNYIIKNLQFQFSNENENNICIELGSGCGLIGLLLAKLNSCNKVYLTDQLNQLTLLQENIKLNHLEYNTRCYELDWYNNNMIQKYINDNNYPDYIIAADVLYSETMAISLFNVIKKLSFTKKTKKILIAQKIRDNNNILNVNILSKDFIFNKILEESNVILWNIELMN